MSGNRAVTILLWLMRGGVLAYLVYVDLHPFRAGLSQDPRKSVFCSARYRPETQTNTKNAALTRHLVHVDGHPLLNAQGKPRNSWTISDLQSTELTHATAQILRSGIAANALPEWSHELLPRLGVQTSQWLPTMAKGDAARGTAWGSGRSAVTICRGSTVANGQVGAVYGELNMRVPFMASFNIRGLACLRGG